MDEYALFAPSCPTEAEIQDLPLHTSSGLMELLNIPTEIRTSAETEALVTQMESYLSRESEATLLSQV